MLDNFLFHIALTDLLAFFLFLVYVYNNKTLEMFFNSIILLSFELKKISIEFSYAEF